MEVAFRGWFKADFKARSKVERPERASEFRDRKEHTMALMMALTVRHGVQGRRMRMGVMAVGMVLLAAPLGDAQRFKTLLNFDATSGKFPMASLMQGTDGGLYGTTELGGASSACVGGCGTVFKITPAGTLTSLHSFQGTDGSEPIAGLIQATDGNFYGTTYEGGASGVCSGGCGTVFKMTATGALTTLHNFDSTDGANPLGALVQATDGNFYGTTTGGGAYGAGTVFKITPMGALTTLHSFDPAHGGGPAEPAAALIQATDGNLYGTTLTGGAKDQGTVFRITLTGTLRLVESFDGNDGANPSAALIQAIDGNFYGTTSAGGASGVGTVFRITPTGTLTTLFSFDVIGAGENPSAALIQATDGNFYGTTVSGGDVNACFIGCGTVFKTTPSGVLTILHNFESTDGANPYAALVQNTGGAFYAPTSSGGTSGACSAGCGTLFGLAVGLGPFVRTLPTSSRVGAPVRILGTNLTGATGVTFNGVAATFTVVSASEIITLVPFGATTGRVQVVTPSGTLSSNVPFRVQP